MDGPTPEKMPELIWVVDEISDQLEALLSLISFNLVLILATIVVFWIGVIVVRTLGRTASFSLSPLGFSRHERGALFGVVVGASVGVGAVFLGGLVNLLTTLIFESLGYSTESRVQQEFMRGLTGWVGEQPSIAVPAVFLVLVIIGPFAEELIFRGAVFNGLYRLGLLAFRQTFGKERGRLADIVSFTLGALVSSAVFAYLHLEPVLLPSLLILAVALCWLFRWSGSLLPSFVAHATFNSFATTVVVLSGLGVFELPI